jgi:hypothetical protein
LIEEGALADGAACSPKDWEEGEVVRDGTDNAQVIWEPSKCDELVALKAGEKGNCQK